MINFGPDFAWKTKRKSKNSKKKSSKFLPVFLSVRNKKELIKAELESPQTKKNEDSWLLYM